MKNRMIAVVPQIMQSEIDPFLQCPELLPPDRRRAPLEASFVLGTPWLKPLPGLRRRAFDMTCAVLQDDGLAVAVQIAAAHVVAKNALEDPNFRCDRYASRVDEWCAIIWSIAQEVFEANADFARNRQAGMCSPIGARGLGFDYKGLASARIYPRTADGGDAE